MSQGWCEINSPNIKGGLWFLGCPLLSAPFPTPCWAASAPLGAPRVGAPFASFCFTPLLIKALQKPHNVCKSLVCQAQKAKYCPGSKNLSSFLALCCTAALSICLGPNAAFPSEVYQAILLFTFAHTNNTRHQNQTDWQAPNLLSNHSLFIL